MTIAVLSNRFIATMTGFGYARHNKHQVSYVSANCGAGKTYALAHYICGELAAAAFDEPVQFMYVAPSIKLLEQFSDQLTQLGVKNYSLIATHRADDNVFERLTTHLTGQALYQDAHVTLITHASFVKLPIGLRHPNKWRIFIDEFPQVDHYYDLDLPQSHTLLNKYIDAETVTERLTLIKKRAGSELIELIKTKDTGLEPFKEVLQKIASSNYSVYTDAKSYDRVFSPSQGNFDPAYRLPLLAILNPSVFEGCCILGANFEETMLFDHLKRHQLTLVPHAELQKQLRYKSYPAAIGQRTSIRYCLENGRYSKSIQKRLTATGENVKAAIDRTILDHLPNEPFLLSTNRDDDGDLAKSPYATRLTGSPNGLNDYDQHDRIVFISALNRPTKHFSMLKDAGFSRDVVQTTTLVEAAHQATMRTNLRVPGSSSAVEIIVTDRWLAHQLGTILGCTDIKRIGTIDVAAPTTAKPTPYSQSEKNRRAKIQKLMRSLPAVVRDMPDEIDASGTEENEAQNALPNAPIIRSNGNQFGLHGIATSTTDSGIWLTFHRHLHDSAAHQFKTCCLNAKELVSVLKTAAKTPVGSKDELWLLNACRYQDDLSTGYRTQANFRSASLLILDFDNGKLSPEDFERIFWHDAGLTEKRSFVIANSFSRSTAQPNRFRVVIPFCKPVTSLQVFEAVHDDIVERLERQAYTKEELGLDKVSRNPVQSYFLPCTNRAETSQAFFRSYGMTSDKFNKFVLDPSAYAVISPTVVTKSTSKSAYCCSAHQPVNSSTSSRRQTTKAEGEWIDSEKNELRTMKTGRHTRFFNFAIKLRSIGFPLSDIQTQLNQVAGDDREMLRKAAGIMKSLRKYAAQNRKR